VIADAGRAVRLAVTVARTDEARWGLAHRLGATDTASSSTRPPPRQPDRLRRPPRRGTGLGGRSAARRLAPPRRGRDPRPSAYLRRAPRSAAGDPLAARSPPPARARGRHPADPPPVAPRPWPALARWGLSVSATSSGTLTGARTPGSAHHRAGRKRGEAAVSEGARETTPAAPHSARRRLEFISCRSVAFEPSSPRRRARRCQP